MILFLAQIFPAGSNYLVRALYFLIQEFLYYEAPSVNTS